MGHEIQIPKPIYAKLEVQDVDGFVVKVRSCWATPTANSDDATTYKFIDSYHVVATESNEVVIFQNCVDSTAAFRVNSFSFGASEGQVFSIARLTCATPLQKT